MDHIYLLKKLREQKAKSESGDLEIWLQTTYNYIADCFKIYDSKTMNFKKIVDEYEMKKIIGIDNQFKINTRIKAIEYLNYLIQYLEEFEEQNEKLKPNKDLREIKYIPLAPEKETIIKNKPLGINPEAFWPIFLTIIGGAFFIGQQFGIVKFDKEKSDIYETNKKSNIEKDSLINIINNKNKILLSKDSIIQIKDDSIKLLDERMLGLSLLINDLSKKNKKDYR